MESVEIKKIISSIKKKIKKNINKSRYNNALDLISMAAIILYNANLCYVDDELENFIDQIACKIIRTSCNVESLNSETLLFYDGFGLNSRGLAQIYIKALCENNNVIYVTNKKSCNHIPDIESLIKSNNGKIIWLEGEKSLKCIAEMREIIEFYKPKDFFFYSIPNDVIGTVIMSAYKGIMKIFQVNLTDHAFWLGANNIDYCVEFRDYGASISNEYRGISRDKIVKVPFYPIINYKQKFLGFPFVNNSDMKIIFSGGALYKTFDSKNTYYRIVDHILQTHSDTIFWYAGEGDMTEMNKITKRYPQRVYITSERKDLYQVLENIYLYLSTYPLCGGLMFQYAASASKVPITLRQGDVTDDFLINQNEMGIQFDDYSSFINELDHLIDDPEYNMRKGQLVKKAVITEKKFREALTTALVEGKSIYKIKYKHVDSKILRENYLSCFSKAILYKLFVQKDNKIVIKNYPIYFLYGCLLKILDKLKTIICRRCVGNNKKKWY